jgi:hypothetical protein
MDLRNFSIFVLFEVKLMKIVMPNKLHATIGKTIYLVRWLCAYALLKCNEALFYKRRSMSGCQLDHVFL